MAGLNIVQLLQLMVQSDGSDLHLAVKSVPMIRVRGEMQHVKVAPLSQQDMEALYGQIMTAKDKEEFLKDQSLDFAFSAQGVGVFRVNAFQQRHGWSLVFRVLPENPPTIEQLNLEPIFKKAASYPNGLILITGPTGSGKSTTMAAMLNDINMNRKGHILTLEDPVEFRHESKMCMVNQRSLGAHFPTFSSALKAALREDPDVILVGEMRDPETIGLALKAAETGHLVFSTLHTNSAAKTIDRIINVFPAEEQPAIRTSLSETLRMVASQKLVPTMDGKKRICFKDVLIVNPAVSNLIREQKTHQLITVMQTGKALGMQLLDAELLKAVQEGKVKGATAWEFANDKEQFKQFDPAGGGSSSGAPPASGGGTPPAAPGGVPQAQPGQVSGMPGMPSFGKKPA